MRRPAIALLSAVLAVTAVVVPTSAEADGAPPKRIVSGWIPYWMSSPSSPGGVTSLVQNADLLTDVSPFWYSAVAKSGGGVQVKFNANFGNGAANAAWAMGQLKAAGIPVLPAIADSSGKGRMAATLANPGLRAAHVADIVNLVVSNGYDGIDLDYEGFAFTDGSSSWAATKPNWTAFIQELGAALHAQGKLLAVTIPPPCSMSGTCSQATGYWVYNMTGIAPSADRIRIMAYDYSVRGIGPLAPMPWVRAIVQYSASVMDPARLQIGVPTYGRAWTRLTSSGAYRLSGVCPTDKSSSAYRSLTGMQSPSGSTIPALLASVGATGSVEWDAEKQEYTAYYDKAVQWTDSSGASQTCTAKRVLQFLGPQGVLARTQLVGEFGLSAAAYWTIGGEDPAQWPVLRAYGQSLAPAGTDVATVGVPSAVFGTPLTFTATVGYQRRRDQFNVNVTRRNQESTLNGDAETLFSTGGSWSHTLSNRLSTGLTADYQTREGDAQAQTSDFVFISPFVNYTIGPHVSSRLSYSYMDSVSGDATDDFTENAVQGTLSFAF